ncbi:hypothetical protein AB685_23365 [Bacillus sp. LL01]|nr:hypothetical protein AB685_23365 [Bacillus sp. LL01]
MIEHAGCISYVRSFADEFNITEDTTVLQHTAYNFDTIVEEVYPVHIRGGKVVLYNEEKIYDINKACDYMDKHEVSLISCSTLLLKEFNQGRMPKTVNMYLNGGDTLKYSYINNLLKHANVGNTFGSTEQTVCAAFYQVPKNRTGTIPAGKPIVGRNVYICQGDQICGIGIPGELCITGSGVSRGYLNSEELTRKKFVNNPFGEGKMYKSGDLVRWLPDGNIEFLGRIDHQVKIRGFRVELQEIEEVFNKQAGVKETVVLAKEQGEGVQALFAYVVMEEKEALDLATIKEGARKELPEYMIPSYMMAIDEIPLTVNGKTDKKALPDIEFERQDDYIAPSNPIEVALCKIFEEVLGIKKVGIKDNFFELGGDSIKAIRFTTLCRNQNYDLSIKEFMKKGTVIELAKALMDKKQEKDNEHETFTKVPMNPLLNEYLTSAFKYESNLCHSKIVEVKEYDETLKTVLEGMIITHPMLRVKYTDNELEIIDYLPYEIPTYDLTSYEEGSGLTYQLRDICVQLQESIITMQGLLFELVFIRTKTKNFILLCGHKLVVDSWSLNLLSQEINRNYELLNNGEYKLTFKEDIYYLKNIKALGGNDPSLQLDYWSQISNEIEKGKIKPDTNLGNRGFTSIEFAISEKETTALLDLSESVLGMDINEVLMANFAIAANKLTNQEKVSVTFIDIDRNRDKGIGSYEYRYPIVLPSNGANLVETLCDVKKNLNYIPNNGERYGWLSLNHRFYPQPNVLFHGLDKIEDDYLNRGMVGERDLHDHIAIYSLYKDNKISFYMEYNESKFSKGMMDKISEYYLRSLISISEEVTKYEKKNMFLLNEGMVDAKLLYKDFFEDMYSYGKSIAKENIVGEYDPLLSQQVFLDDTIGGGSSGRFIIEGEYAICEVERAILRIISEQSVLRTQYIKKKNVLIENELSMDHKIPVIDISSDSNQKETQLYSIVEKFGLDTKNLLEGPLLNKIGVIKAAKDKYVIYIFIHHALWDMTSSSIFERRINQLLKEPDLLQRRKEIYLYSQVIKNAINEEKSKDIQFNEFIEATQNMNFLYENKSRMTVFKKKYDEDIVNNTVMSNQLLATLQLLETIILQEEMMSSVNKIPVIILHHGRDVTNRRTLGLFQEAKLFTIDLNDRYRYERVRDILADSPELSLGIKDLNQVQKDWLKDNVNKIPSLNAVTSYGDDSGIMAERTLDINNRKIVDLSTDNNLPINVRCQFTDGGVVLVATGFENRKSQVLDAMDKIILEGYRIVECI